MIAAVTIDPCIQCQALVAIPNFGLQKNEPTK